MHLISPLRYPGGKGSLGSLLAQVIELNDLKGCSYYEPFAGGGGAALFLLKEGFVSEIFINDLDRRISAFWSAVIHHTDRFVDQVLTVPLTIPEWHRQNEICSQPSKHQTFDLGFAAFYMNRCNRSGVLDGAGPIGGYHQEGKWRMDVRFERNALAERILKLSNLKERIHLSQLDALKFLKAKIPKGNARATVFVYLDPPYVKKGGRLYLNAYEKKDHRRLANYVNAQKKLPWIMSYDDHELIRTLYSRTIIANLPIRYSLQEKRSASELILSPRRIQLPNGLQPLIGTTVTSRRKGTV